YSSRISFRTSLPDAVMCTVRVMSLPRSVFIRRTMCSPSASISGSFKGVTPTSWPSTSTFAHGRMRSTSSPRTANGGAGGGTERLGLACTEGLGLATTTCWDSGAEVGAAGGTAGAEGTATGAGGGAAGGEGGTATGAGGGAAGTAAVAAGGVAGAAETAAVAAGSAAGGGTAAGTATAAACAITP